MILLARFPIYDAKGVKELRIVGPVTWCQLPDTDIRDGLLVEATLCYMVTQLERGSGSW